MANNWIGNSQPVQAKTEVRIQAQKADNDLNNMLVERETANPVLKDNLSVSGIWASFRQLRYRSNSDCQLYIDRDTCEYGSECKYNIFKLECPVNVKNPFGTTNTDVLIIDDIKLTDTDLHKQYNANGVIDYGTLETFLNNIALSFGASYSIVTYSNRNYQETDINLPSYFAVPYKFTASVPVGATTFTHLYGGSLFEEGLCIHIAGCSGLCAGKKVETNLPPSNIYKDETGHPELLNNCNPFDCYPVNTVGISACLSKCPFNAIKHKLTDSSALPTSVDSLKESSRAMFNVKPFTE